eukprot:Awhi_evm1s13293
MPIQEYMSVGDPDNAPPEYSEALFAEYAEPYAPSDTPPPYNEVSYSEREFLNFQPLPTSNNSNSDTPPRPSRTSPQLFLSAHRPRGVHHPDSTRPLRLPPVIQPLQNCTTTTNNNRNMMTTTARKKTQSLSNIYNSYLERVSAGQENELTNTTCQNLLRPQSQEERESLANLRNYITQGVQRNRPSSNSYTPRTNWTCPCLYDMDLSDCICRQRNRHRAVDESNNEAIFASREEVLNSIGINRRGSKSVSSSSSSFRPRQSLFDRSETTIVSMEDVKLSGINIGRQRSHSLQDSAHVQSQGLNECAHDVSVNSTGDDCAITTASESTLPNQQIETLSKTNNRLRSHSLHHTTIPTSQEEALNTPRRNSSYHEPIFSSQFEILPEMMRNLQVNEVLTRFPEGSSIKSIARFLETNILGK